MCVYSVCLLWGVVPLRVLAVCVVVSPLLWVCFAGFLFVGDAALLECFFCGCLFVFLCLPFLV